MTFSCCKENSDIVMNKYDKDSIELSLENQDSIHLWCRSTVSFDAISEGDYSIESQDTSIIKVSAQKNHFTLKSVDLGSTNITISNSFGAQKVLLCRSLGFANYWSETPELTRIYKNTLMVVADDKNTAELIREELKPIYLNRGHEYKFINGSDKMTVLIPTQGDPKKGTYSFDVTSQILTLEYNNICEKYFCDIQPPYPNFFLQPRFIVALKQDLTEKYLAKYPQAGISDVYIIRHVMALGDYWLIDNINKSKTDSL